MPVVSVLMVCHRDTPYLRPAVASVLAQTFADFELVLVDNGARLSPAALGELGADPRIRRIDLPENAGIAAGHNAGVEAARGEFIALLDHDDVMLPTRLTRQVALLRAAPNLGLVASRAETIDAVGRVIAQEFALLEGRAQREYSAFAAPVVTPAYTGRRTVFVRFPYRTEFVYTADFDFLARAAEAVEFGAVDEVLLRYRRHAAQTTVEHSAQIAAERCVVRLLTARRRRGRMEGSDWPDLPRKLEGETADESAMLRRFGERCLREGLWVQAAYHVRRSIAVHRSPPSLLGGAAVFARTWASARGERARVARMFFGGPVKVSASVRRT